MSSLKMENEYKVYEFAVKTALEQDDKGTGSKILDLINKNVIKAEETFSEDVMNSYQVLASRLRAHIYRRFSTRDIPKVFKNDIAHVLYKRSYDVIQDVSIYLDRFKMGDDFARQQKKIVNNLLENKQRLTQDSLVVDESKKVSATVGNWIKYFYRKVGGDQVMNRIKIAEFFSKDSNIVKLSEDELHKVKNLIQLQEYLRRPTDELRQELLEIMIDIGDGRLAVFEDGDFSILFGLEEQAFVADRLGLSDKKVNVDGLSEVEALVKQTKAKRPKRTELSPINKDEKVAPKKPKSIDKKEPEKKKTAKEIVDALLERTSDETDNIGKFSSNVTKITLEGNISNLLETPNKYLAIAVLDVIAKENLWKDVLKYENIQSLAGNSLGGDVKKEISFIIRTFLEKHDIMKADDSARIAAQLTNSIHTFQEYKNVHLVYFDMTTQSFHWHVN